jgi:hypothetical protein
MTDARVANLLQPRGGKADYSALSVLGVAAVGLGAARPRSPHAGLLYRWKKEVRLFEMRGHEELADAPVQKSEFVWIEPSAITPERLKLVAVRARMVKKSHDDNKIPYGFSYQHSAFDEKGGLRLGPGECGFTCSTILAAIFESEKLKLIDQAQWPAPDADDNVKRTAFISELRKTNAVHAKVLEADINAPRVSPEEVVAAAGRYPLLGTFETLQDGAADVRARIGT